MAVALKRVIETICARSGLAEAQYDASELEDVEIPGFELARLTTGLNALVPLRMVGAFDIVDRGDHLKFVRRGAAPVVTIEHEELGAHAEGEERRPPISTTTAQDVELPLQIRLEYSALSRDYEHGEQLSPSRIGTVGVNEVTVQCPVVLTDDQAAQVAEVLHREAWASRHTHEFVLGPDRHALEPADPLLVPVDGRLLRMRIQTIDDQGPQLRRVVAVRDDDGAYVSTAVASTASNRPPARVTILAETEVVLMDLPALREEHDDAGFYVAGYKSGGGFWPGGRLYKSVDGSVFSLATELAASATVGEVVSAPAGGDGYTWDDAQEYVVDVVSGTLENRTDAALFAGANAAAVGAHGRWHIFQFGSAELVSAGRYRLTHLLLGRRGTEHLIPTVQPGDTFVLISGPGIYRVPLQVSEIGAERTYRATTAGTPSSSGTDLPFTGAGQALEPFSPVDVDVDADTSGDVTINWLRRDRLAQTLRSGADIPLSEASEAYEVEILDDDTALTVLRTIAASTTEATYTAAEQLADFGELRDDFRFRIYQLSAVVGRGAPYESF